LLLLLLLLVFIRSGVRVGQTGMLPLRDFLELAMPYLPDSRDASFKDWLLSTEFNADPEQRKDTSKCRIDYTAFTERIQQMERRLKAANAAEGNNNNGEGHELKTRSLVYDFHKFEDFFRGRVVQCVIIVIVIAIVIVIVVIVVASFRSVRCC
jgi:hypothetical protein